MTRSTFALFSNLVIVLGLGGQTSPVEQVEPTAIFSGIFWGKPTTRSLLFAPWGNYDEENSTKALVRVGYGSLSPKCAYYGKGKIEFHQKRNYTELELDLMSDKSQADRTSFFAELPFSGSNGQTKEFIALFSPKNQQGDYQAFFLPFEKEEIPWGSYKLFSQFNETLYLSAGKKSYSLEPGKNLILSADDFKKGDRVRILIYRKIKGNYQEVAAQSFGVNDRQRGIFFLTSKRAKVHLVPMVETKKPIEQAIGFGSEPFENEQAEEGKSDSSDLRLAPGF